MLAGCGSASQSEPTRVVSPGGGEEASGSGGEGGEAPGAEGHGGEGGGESSSEAHELERARELFEEGQSSGEGGVESEEEGQQSPAEPPSVGRGPRSA